MKKTYFSPVTKVVVLRPLSMIADSIGNGKSMFGSATNGTSEEYADARDNAWDIWGQGDYEED